MKAKLMLTLGVALVSGLNVFGQDANANKRTEKIEKHTVQTNLFGSNWFVGAGVGAQMYFGDNFKAGNAGKLITPTFEVRILVPTRGFEPPTL